jgi:hypothetical protein
MVALPVAVCACLQSAELTKRPRALCVKQFKFFHKQYCMTMLIAVWLAIDIVFDFRFPHV